MSPAPWNSEPLMGYRNGNNENSGKGGHSAGDEMMANHLHYQHQNPISNSLKSQVPMRPSPIVHPAVDAPICPECQALDSTFFNPECKACQNELETMAHHGIGIASIFAILRQWIPQVQQCIEFLVDEALRMGAHPDDRDSVTDMTFLMFTCKAGAAGVGDGTMAAKVAQKMIDLGASLKIRCRWTNMASLHYAAYFDVSPVLNMLLKASKGIDVDTTCSEYDNGTALHIAAANLGVSAAQVLLNFGADLHLVDDLARKAHDCIPEMHAIDVTLPTDDVEEMIGKLKILLHTNTKKMSTQEANELMADHTSFGLSSWSINTNRNNVTTGRSVMNALGLRIGDRVFVNGNKLGTLQFCGATEFAGGIWAGVSLGEAEGKNDGTVKGVTYFRCPFNHGVFVPPNKLAKAGKNYKDPTFEQEKPCYTRPPMTKVNHGKVDVSKVAPRIHEAMTVIAKKGKDEIKVGDRVNVKDLVANDGTNKTRSCLGTVRFVGSVDFVKGDNKWFGIELDEPLGRHDGTVEEIRYFAAADDHGVFVTDARLIKLHNQPPKPGKTISDEHESQTFSMNYHTLEDSLETTPTLPSEEEPANERSRSKSPSSSSNGTKTSGGDHKPRPLRRSLSMQHRASKANGSVTSTSAGRPPSSNGPNSIISTQGFNRKNSEQIGNGSENNSSPRSATSDSWHTVGAVHPNKFQMKKSPRKKYIDVGTTVICIHTKEMGVVKYVGRTDFAPGIWLGMELRNPKGKHDGQIGGRRYFQTKINHGVMIRPKMASVHGINGEELLKPETEYPF